VPTRGNLQSRLMQEHTAPEAMFGPKSNYLFAKNLDERARLERQFHLLQEDFFLWFGEALRLASLDADAPWSALDLGCGDGQFARELARRYPRARVTGMDVDKAAIATAVATSGALRNVEFAVHDAREPLPAVSRYDVVVMWMVLLYLPDKAGGLAQVATAMRPGGALLLCNVTDEPVRFSHPVATELANISIEIGKRFGAVGLEGRLAGYLDTAGFTDVTTAVLRYQLGGGTASGQRWWAHWLATVAATRRAVVDVAGLMGGAEFDRKVAVLADAPTLREHGEWPFLVTLARRSR
jgi:SAM-dependent methyltransferase